ncbi:C-terminal-binding protein-like isoform X2 [Amphiura filiformis]|uniref:C-terminal-binding protein-like isoform X2 n=1 Tax=Amphiura filiformis TaxID=82378 RepID=UPI003B211BD2
MADGPINLKAADADAQLAKSTKPLVVLIDGKHCEIQHKVLKDVATVAYADVHAIADIPEKVYAEAVGIFIYHPLEFQEAELRKFKKLKVIARLGTGYNNVDIKVAGEMGITVSIVPDYGVEEIADTTMCMILNVHRHMHLYANMVRQGVQLHNFEETEEAGTGTRRVRGQTLGLVGLGNIGVAVAVRAKAFGFNVLFYDPFLRHSVEKALVIQRAKTLEELLTNSDCLSLHCMLTKENYHFLNDKTLRLMKRGSMIVNTARGGLIDELALSKCLKDGQIGAACLDTLEKEPFNFTFDQPLHDAPNVICTPHCAFYSQESVIEMREKASLDVKRALAGEELNGCVNNQFLKKK